MDLPDVYLFASYSRKDRPAVVPFLERLERHGVNLFYDVHLQPGENWKAAITAALDRAAGVLVFVTPRSMATEYVQREIAAAAGTAGRLLIPVVIEWTADQPPELRSRQAVDIAGKGEDELEAAAGNVAAVFRRLQRPTRTGAAAATGGVDDRAAEAISADLRECYRPADPTAPPQSVFVVHGHDEHLLDEVRGFITRLGVRPVVLTRVRGPSQSLFQKFLQFGREARFALVLLSADDYGASRRQFDAPGVGERALQFRARQNVILELGFFYGFLGWENVFVLVREPDRVYPNFERPTDLDGVVFDRVDDAGEWKDSLRKKLADAGFVLQQDA